MQHWWWSHLRRVAKAFACCALGVGMLAIAMQPTGVLAASTSLPGCSGDFQPQFHKLSLEHGLSQSVVNTIAQDRDGFLWLGTQDGLNRYDGYQFTVYRRQSDNPQSLPDNQINALAVDEAGTLWVGTVSGLARRTLGNDTFERIPSEILAGDYVLSLLADGNGRVWIGSSQGLSVYDLASQQFTTVIGNNARRLPDEHVRALLHDEGAVWIGTARGLYRYAPQTAAFDDPVLADRNITSLLLRADGHMVVGTQSGLYEASMGATRRFNRVNIEMPSEFVQSVLEDNRGRLWIGSAAGLVVRQSGGRTCLLTRQLGRTDTLSANDVLSLYQDRSGVIWVGTYAGGLNNWNTQSGQFRQYLSLADLPRSARSNTVSAVLRDRERRLWLGTTDSGLFRLEADRVIPIALMPPAHQLNATERQIASLLASGSIPINQLLEDQRGRLWAGSFGAGLFLLEGERPVRRFDSATNDAISLSSSFVLTVYEDHQGEIWVGTENGFDQLMEAADGNISFRRFGAQLPVAFQAIDTEINSIIEDYDGVLWLGGLGGLIRLDRDRETMTLYQHDERDANSLSGNSVTALRLAPDGDIWVATTDGLSRLHRKLGGDYEITRFTVSDGIPPGAVYGMLPGEDGELWLSSSSGLVRFQPNGRYGIQYRQSNGLPSDEFNIGAVYLAADGERLFGSINGAVGFYPERLAKPDSSARVVLTGFRKFDQPQSLAFASNARPLLQLNSDDRIVSFDVAVLDFAEAQRNQFRYRVLGLHEQWIPLTGSRTITLTGLEPGRYQLQVQGAPATGLWSQQSLTIDLVVRSPLWTVHTTYGSIIAAMLALMTGVALYSWRRTRRRLHSLQERNYALTVKAETSERSALDHEHRANELQDVADQLEQQRASLQRRLVDVQYQDPLTGLPSRRLAEQFFARFQAKPGLRAMILVDADGMGYLNEQHGYAAGDSVLAQLGDLLQRVCRHGDAIMRWDSDVFLLICEVADMDEASRLAERIRASVLQQAFTLSERRHVDLTCSIGFSLWSVPTDVSAESPGPWRWQVVLGFAREALALAKHFSRNAWFALVPTEAIPPAEIALARRELAHSWVERGWLAVSSSLPIPSRLTAEWPRR